MPKGGKGGGGHQVFKDRAKNRVDDLQGLFSNLQSARKDSRSKDIVLLEEQVHQMLREWKAELNQPSPASSFQGDDSLGSFSSEIKRLLQINEEEDDATSKLAAPKQDPDAQTIGINVALQQVSTFVVVEEVEEKEVEAPKAEEPAAATTTEETSGNEKEKEIVIEEEKKEAVVAEPAPEPEKTEATSAEPAKVEEECAPTEPPKA